MSTTPAPAPHSAPLEQLHQASIKLVESMLARLPEAGGSGLQESLQGFLQALAAQPQRVAQINARHYDARLALWVRLLGDHTDAALSDAPTDRRFRAQEWRDLPFFRLLREGYDEDARWLHELIEAVQLPHPLQQRLRFLAKHFVAAAAPSNHPATNPEAIRQALATGGQSVLQGLRNLQHDLAQGTITMADEQAFEVGRNLAVTPGAVVYENALMQLIEYAPMTEQVHVRPLLIVPPFINKYYILDLQPHNSFVRFALEQGLRVFLVSWRNAGADLRGATWEDYVRDGVLRPLDVALAVSGSRRLSALGFCVGGTLLASALAVMDAPQRVSSLTLLACLLDFSDVGEIGVFIDEDYVRRCETDFARGGLMPGARIASAFASLRPDDLIWFFVVNNYLKGEAPAAFDLLYWNSDSTNVPGPLFAWYVRHMYLENALRRAGHLQLRGRGVDLGRLRMPIYLLATREDHIVPWRCAHAGARLLAGTIETVLGASGHVAGIVAPPRAGRGYWTSPQACTDPDMWLQQAQKHEGSWWEHWARWVIPKSGARKIAVSELGSPAYPVIEQAPGRYVRERNVSTH